MSEGGAELTLRGTVASRGLAFGPIALLGPAGAARRAAGRPRRRPRCAPPSPAPPRSWRR